MSRGFKRALYVVVFGSLIGIAAEQRSCSAPPLSLPPIADSWKLNGLPDCARPVPARFQIWRGTQGARQVCRGEYAGPLTVTLTLYDMPEAPGATSFDAFQKFQVEPGKQAFFRGRFFGVAESQGAGMETLTRFTTAIQARLPK